MADETKRTERDAVASLLREARWAADFLESYGPGSQLAREHAALWDLMKSYGAKLRTAADAVERDCPMTYTMDYFQAEPRPNLCAVTPEGVSRGDPIALQLFAHMERAHDRERAAEQERSRMVHLLCLAIEKGGGELRVATEALDAGDGIDLFVQRGEDAQETVYTVRRRSTP